MPSIRTHEPQAAKVERANLTTIPLGQPHITLLLSKISTKHNNPITEIALNSTVYIIVLYSLSI